MKKKESKLWAVLAIILTVILCLIIGSCKTIKVNGGTHTRDSVRVEHRIDTMYQITFDSVRIQLPCSDTIQVAYVDRFHAEYEYKSNAVHDTTFVNKTDTIYEPYEVPVVTIQNSKMANFALWYMWISIAVIVMVISLKIYKKVHTL